MKQNVQNFTYANKISKQNKIYCDTTAKEEKRAKMDIPNNFIEFIELFIQIDSITTLAFIMDCNLAGLGTLLLEKYYFLTFVAFINAQFTFYLSVHINLTLPNLFS